MKKMMMALAVIGLMCFSFSIPVLAYDDLACNSDSSTETIQRAAGCNNSQELPGVAVNILNTMIGLVGVVAVIVIIIGGINFAVSSGDAGKVKKAKDTVLYGVIGLIVAILAFAIVSFIAGAIG